MFRRTALRNAISVGHTVDSLRLADAIRAVRVVMKDPQVDPGRVTVFGRRSSAGLAIYAAILLPEISQVAVMEAPSTHKEAPIFLNVLQYTDLPEVAALLLPRTLAFVGDMPDAYALTRDIARIVKKEHQVMETMSIEGLLEGKLHHSFPAGW
jgi:cephalosporin-C deacetylase-like acetyl esterase